MTRTKFNRKRRLSARAISPNVREELIERIQYGGNPEHKSNPGDFGLTPPRAPRPGKTLCDAAGIASRATADDLLREGLRRGLFSERLVDGWPQNIWAVTADGVALEAQREAPGVYHGYPMPEGDPLRDSILDRWNEQ